MTLWVLTSFEIEASPSGCASGELGSVGGLEATHNPRQKVRHHIYVSDEDTSADSTQALSMYLSRLDPL